MARNTALTPSIVEEAAHWWVTFHEGDASPAEHREFAEWVARSPERVEAYLRAAQLEHTLKKSDIDWPATPIEVLVSEAKASRRDELEIRRGPAAPAESRTWFAPGNFAPRRFAFGFAAVCLCVGVSVWFMLMRPLELQTRLGEQRSVMLADGTRVTLNTATKVEIVLREKQRLARLLEGEALFEVAHDDARPFEVTTERATFKDVGTQFDVDRRSDHTTITVVEGRVQVASSDRPGDAGATILSAADQLVIGPAGASNLKHDVNVKAAMSWLQQRLVFERRTLGDVAAEFNRYNPDKIQIESAELRDQAITGVFQSNAVGSFISFLEDVPGVQVRDDPKGNHHVTFDGTAPPVK
jgi:transmembrane sensor